MLALVMKDHPPKPYVIRHGRRTLATLTKIAGSDQWEIRWKNGGVSRCCSLRSAMDIIASERLGPPRR